MSTIYLSPELDEVSEEADKARHKFGEQTGLTDLEWLAVLAEEFGEAAQVVTQACVPPIEPTPDDRIALLRGELLQVAAVACRWIRAIDDRDDA